MNHYANMINQLKTPEIMKQLTHLYGNHEGMLVEQTNRYSHLIKKHNDLVGNAQAIHMISAPGRTEIGGNHTDHNSGKVLAAAVNLDTLAAVTPRNDEIVNIYSEGYAPLSLSLSDLELKEEEKGTTAGLVRGVAFKMSSMGFVCKGFDAVIQSTVRSGSGLSSSAAIEVLICEIFDKLYNNHSLDYKTRAKISQFAENVYFGKPSGLMDQMASSCGGLAFIDFRNSDPDVKPIAFDFNKFGYSLVVVATGGSHDDLTADYAAIPEEMRAVANNFSEDNLRAVSFEEFMKKIPVIRKELNSKYVDRSLLRAYHYFTENQRVRKQVDALLAEDLKTFFSLIIESGQSSFMYLQNIFCRNNEQELSLALMLSEQKLKNNGAWRVHGGGFAGTTLNFVPNSQLSTYIHEMEAVFGKNTCDVLSIRPVGPACIDVSSN